MTELELGLCANPQDDAAWLEYSKELTSNGDARGELIRLELKPKSPETDAAIEQLITEHQSQWLGKQLATILAYPRPVVQLSFRYGFVERAVFSADLPANVVTWPPLREQIAIVMGSPAAKFVAEIETGILEDDGDADSMLQIFATNLFPALRRLSLGAVGHPKVGGEDVAGALCAGAPNLEVLSLEMRGPHLEPLQMSSLTHLQIVAAELSKHSMESLARSSLPALETVNLSIAGVPDPRRKLRPRQRPTTDSVAAAMEALLRSQRMRDFGVFRRPLWPRMGRGFGCGKPTPLGEPCAAKRRPRFKRRPKISVALV